MREVVLLRGSNGLSELREPTDGGVRGAFISELQEERCDGVTTLFHPGFCQIAASSPPEKSEERDE